MSIEKCTEIVDYIDMGSPNTGGMWSEYSMPIHENLSKRIQQYKLERDLSVSELAEELGIARSVLESYLNGTGNPRADTLEMLSKKSGIPLSELVTGRPSGWDQAKTVISAAKEFGTLPPELQERGISLFLALVELFSKGNPK